MNAMLAQHQPVSIVTGPAEPTPLVPSWTPWAGGVVLVCAGAALILMLRRRTVRKNPLGAAFAGLVSSLKLTAREAAFVKELARAGGMSPAGVLLSSTAYDGAVLLMRRAGKDAALAGVIRSKLEGTPPQSMGG